MRAISIEKWLDQLNILQGYSCMLLIFLLPTCLMPGN